MSKWSFSIEERKKHGMTFSSFCLTECDDQGYILKNGKKYKFESYSDAQDMLETLQGQVKETPIKDTLFALCYKYIQQHNEFRKNSCAFFKSTELIKINALSELIRECGLNDDFEDYLERKDRENALLNQV